jgi:ubiquinone/menaquinone biosynthesis C-methylase UbiE
MWNGVPRHARASRVARGQGPANLSGMHRCPWWFTRSFDNPLRRLFQDPARVLEPVVWAGRSVLDLGCGYGYFAVQAARMVGPYGLVHAADLQRRSLDALARRAARAGVAGRVRLHVGDVADLELPDPVDAAYAIWMAHEVDRLPQLAARLVALLKPSASFLIAEPKLHVGERRFLAIVDTFRAAGFVPALRHNVGLSRALVLVAPDRDAEQT